MESSVTALDFKPCDLVSASGDTLGRLRAATSAVRATLRGQAVDLFSMSILAQCDDAIRSELDRLTASSSFGSRRDDVLGAVRLAAAREALGAMSDAYWSLVTSRPAEVSDGLRFRTARCLADLVQWSLCDRRAPPDLVWVRLGTLFSKEAADFSGPMAGDRADVAREYLRAVALVAAELDRLSLHDALALCDVLQASLPFLSLERAAAEGVLYVVDPIRAPVPTRVLRSAASVDSWYFVPVAASDFLDELALLLRLGRIPRGVNGRESKRLFSAAQHLKTFWCVAPRMRGARRHSETGTLAVVSGFSRTCQALSSRAAVAPATWRVNNLSRTGLGVLVSPEDWQTVPDSGELLGLRPADGVRWHLGVARRARYACGSVTVGIETLCLRPELICVNKGEEKLNVVACDPIRPGGVVRLLIPPRLTLEDVPLIARACGGVQQLRPLADGSRGNGFDLRSYKVL